MRSQSASILLFGLISAVVPVCLYLANASGSLGFADAAEFALVTKLLSVAHPPGFPAYVTLGYFWSQLFTLFTGNHVWSLILFSACCSGAAGLLVYLTVIDLIKKLFPESNWTSLIAVTSTCAFSYGITVWYWSNSVEVYALQALATALAIYGIIGNAIKHSLYRIIIAGTGIGLGLSNHHLTMVLLLPFLVLLTYPGVFEAQIANPQNKRQKKNLNPNPKIKWWPLPGVVYQLAIISGVVCLLFYGWMYLRASGDFPFEFGNPDSLSRLLYHLAGGAWMKNTAQEVNGIVEMRLPYFMRLILDQFLFFLPIVLFGTLVLLRKKYYRILLVSLGYFLVILIYQLRIDQTSDTDAYLIPCFTILPILVAIGLAQIVRQKSSLCYLLPVLAITSPIINYSKTDKSDFNISESLMSMLDKSAPKNAVILISDWTLVIQYNYYRIAEGFRKDLTVLNYDLKFTNYKTLAVLYPDFYNQIRGPYDTFTELLGAVHPQEKFNTGCTLDTPELMNSYKVAVTAIQKYCLKNNFAFMVDPKAFVFLMQNGLMTSSSYVSGCFVSTISTNKGLSFLDLPFKWLNSDITLREPAATDKLVDFEAMLDFHRNFYKSTNDTLNFNKAEESYVKIKALQRKVKKHLPFVFRSP